MHTSFFRSRAVVRRAVVALFLATFAWPPAAVAAPIVMATNGSSEVWSLNSWRLPSQYHCHCGHSFAIDNGGTSHHHDRVTIVTEPIPSIAAIYNGGAGHNRDRRPAAVTDRHPAAANTWAGHHHDHRPAAVTEPYPSAAAVDSGDAGHRHDCGHPAAVTGPRPAAANTWAVHHHNHMTVDANPATPCPNHHDHPPYNAVTPMTEDASTYAHFYDEAEEEDTNDDEDYLIYSFVPIILTMIFCLVYLSLYFSTNVRKPKNTFSLQTSKCQCTARYVRCSP